MFVDIIKTNACARAGYSGCLHSFSCSCVLRTCVMFLLVCLYVYVCVYGMFMNGKQADKTKIKWCALIPMTTYVCVCVYELV